MRLALSTSWRAPAEAPEAFVERLEALLERAGERPGAAAALGDEAALAGLELDPHLRAPAFAALTARARQSGVPPLCLRAYTPVPDVLPSRHPGGTQAFSPSSPDREERRLAIRAGRHSLEQAADLGAAFVTFDLGRVGGGLPARACAAELWRRHARGELGPGRTSARVARLLEERAALLGESLERVRECLEGWAREADRLGVQVALTNRARLDEIPAPAEALALLEELRGAPIGYLHDVGRAHLCQALGGPSGREWLEQVAPGRLVGLVLHDACGPLMRLPVGTGEAALAEALELAARAVAPEPAAASEPAPTPGPATAPGPATTPGGGPEPGPGGGRAPGLSLVIAPTAEEVARHRRAREALVGVLMLAPATSEEELLASIARTRRLWAAAAAAVSERAAAGRVAG